MPGSLIACVPSGPGLLVALFLVFARYLVIGAAAAGALHAVTGRAWVWWLTPLFAIAATSLPPI